MQETIEYRYPYSFEKTFRRLGSFEKSAFAEENGTFRRPLRGRKGPLLLTVHPHASGTGLTFAVQGMLADGEAEEIRRQVRRMFSLDVDLSPFYQNMRQDPMMAPIIEERGGMHLVLEPTLYECLVKTIISQQLNLSFAATLTERFLRLAGDAFEAEGREWTLFPCPERVASLEPEALQALQFNRRKAETIIGVSRMVAEGRLDLEAFRAMSDEEIVDSLLPIRGIGRWTAECLLLFGLGRPDLLPAADIGLRNAIRLIYGLEERPDEKTVRRMGEAWAPYRSYATFYLWDALDAAKPKKKK